MHVLFHVQCRYCAPSCHLVLLSLYLALISWLDLVTTNIYAGYIACQLVYPRCGWVGLVNEITPSVWRCSLECVRSRLTSGVLVLRATRERAELVRMPDGECNAARLSLY